MKPSAPSIVAPSLAPLKHRLAERLNEILSQRNTLRREHRLQPLVPPLTLDEHEVAELQSLVADIPRLWRHPCVTPEHRKPIVRTLIRAIHVGA